MDYSFFIEYLKQKQYLTDLEKDEMPLAAWMLYQTEETHRAAVNKFIPIPRIKVTDAGVEEYVFVDFECKNYSRDVANPEIDQVGGRFSANRGQIGIIACRAVDDMPKLLERCSDTFKNILPESPNDTKLAVEFLSLSHGTGKTVKAWQTSC